MNHLDWYNPLGIGTIENSCHDARMMALGRDSARRPRALLSAPVPGETLGPQPRVKADQSAKSATLW